MLQYQCPFAKFLISTLVTDIALFTSAIHSKNVMIKIIKELSDWIYLFNIWKNFEISSPQWEPSSLLNLWGTKIAREAGLC